MPDPVGKTPITTWPFRRDSKHFTRTGLKLSDGKLPLLRENPTRRTTDENSGLPAIFDVLFIVCDRTLIKYTLKFWLFSGHVTAADARAFSHPTSKARENRPGDEVAREAG